MQTCCCLPSILPFIEINETYLFCQLNKYFYNIGKKFQQQQLESSVYYTITHEQDVDARLCDFLQLFQDCVIQCHDTHYETMLIFFGSFIHIQAAFDYLLKLVSNFHSITSNRDGRVFLTFKECKTISCELGYQFTIKDLLLDFSITKYYNGINYYQRTSFLSIFFFIPGELGFQNFLKIPTNCAMMFPNQISLTEYFSYKTFHLTTNKNSLQLKTKSDKIMINDIHLQYHLDRLILYMIKKICYILTQCTNYTLLNTEVLYSYKLGVNWRENEYLLLTMFSEFSICDEYATIVSNLLTVK